MSKASFMRPTLALSRRSVLLNSNNKSLGSMVLLASRMLGGRSSRSSSEAMPSKAPCSTLPPAPRWMSSSVNFPSSLSSIGTAPGSTVTWPISAGLRLSGWRPSSGRSASISSPEETSIATAAESPASAGFCICRAYSASWMSGLMSISTSLGSALSKSTSSSSAAASCGGVITFSGGADWASSIGRTSTRRTLTVSVLSSCACSNRSAIFMRSSIRKTATCIRMETSIATAAHQPICSGPGKR